MCCVEEFYAINLHSNPTPPSLCLDPSQKVIHLDFTLLHTEGWWDEKFVCGKIIINDSPTTLSQSLCTCIFKLFSFHGNLSRMKNINSNEKFKFTWQIMILLYQIKLKENFCQLHSRLHNDHVITIFPFIFFYSHFRAARTIANQLKFSSNFIKSLHTKFNLPFSHHISRWRRREVEHAVSAEAFLILQAFCYLQHCYLNQYMKSDLHWNRIEDIYFLLLLARFLAPTISISTSFLECSRIACSAWYTATSQRRVDFLSIFISCFLCKGWHLWKINF